MKKVAVLGAVGILSLAMGTSVFAADITGRYACGMIGHHVSHINTTGYMKEYCDDYTLSGGVCQLAETCAIGCPNGYTLSERVCQYDGICDNLQNGGGYGNVNGAGYGNGNQRNCGSGYGYGCGNGNGHHSGGHGRGCRR